MRSRLYPLHKAAEEGNAEDIRRYLKVGMDSNQRDDDSWTPLHYACFHGHLEVVNELLMSPQMTAVGYCSGVEQYVNFSDKCSKQRWSHRATVCRDTWE